MEKLRTTLVLDYLKSHRRCTYAELMDAFGVSSATIHRYAEELALRDAVTRMRGGLVFNPSCPSDEEPSLGYSERVVTNRKAKMAIAEQALAVIGEGDIVFLDSSTTVYELAMLLRRADFAHLTIVTNSVSIMQNFRKFNPSVVLIGLGGTYDPQLNSCLGAVTLEQLRRISITKAFVSAFGFDSQIATTNHERQAELIHAVLDAASSRYLLVDASKKGRKGLYRLSSMGIFDAVFSC